MQEYVNQMLFYARLKSAHKDYFFEFIKLFDCIEEILDDYDPLLQEKGFEIIIGESIVDSIVYTDRRGLCFIINQAISNTIKYHSDCLEKVPKLCMEFKKEKKTYQFSIKIMELECQKVICLIFLKKDLLESLEKIERKQQEWDYI